MYNFVHRNFTAHRHGGNQIQIYENTKISSADQMSNYELKNIISNYLPMRDTQKSPQEGAIYEEC